MEFWGTEVVSGESVKVKPGKDLLVHISQACLGDIKKDKGNEAFRLFAEKDGQKLVIGVLHPEKFPHVNLDLIFEDHFELSHDGKQGSVHFAGYKVQTPESMSDDESDDDLGETVPVDALINGKPESKASKATASGAKPEKAEGKPKVKIVEPNKDAKDEDDDDTENDDENDDEYDDFDEDEDMPIAEAGSDEDDSDEENDSDEEDDSEEEVESDEETPEKDPVLSKKRPGESTSKTSGTEKKAKFSTPEKKADSKKASGHVATPHPAKQTGKTPANAGKADKQNPKSIGSVACPHCTRSFGSQSALDSHSKAKHGSNAK